LAKPGLFAIAYSNLDNEFRKVAYLETYGNIQVEDNLLYRKFNFKPDFAVGELKLDNQGDLLVVSSEDGLYIFVYYTLSADELAS